MSKVELKSSAKGIEVYLKTRKQTEMICVPLQTEDYVLQPMTDVSPPKWHLGHTTWFFETFLLKRFLPDYKPFHPKYSFVFNSYYESVGERVQRVNRGNLSRPTVNDIFAYRSHVDEYMGHLLATISEEDASEFEKFFTIGINHEQQHQELLVTDIKFILYNNPLMPAYLQKDPELKNIQAKDHVKKLEFLPVNGGVHPIGYAGTAFAWDNEKPVHKVYIDDYKIADRLITNGEYLEFMQDGGYRKFNLWQGEGWDKVNNEKWIAPLYWELIDGQWMNYTLSGLHPIDLNEPVTHISFYEADAFASWAGKRLLTEMEWEIAAQQYKPDVNAGNFLEKENLQPKAIKMQSNEVCSQLLGDTWEWTYSGYFPYPGYKREEGALGEYNGKFMINQMVLRGGSCATPQSHIRISYRNFFHADKRWQFSGIRLAE